MEKSKQSWEPDETLIKKGNTIKVNGRVTICFCETKYVCMFCKKGNYTTMWEHEFIDHIMAKHASEVYRVMLKDFAKRVILPESKFRKPDPKKRCTCDHKDD